MPWGALEAVCQTAALGPGRQFWINWLPKPEPARKVDTPGDRFPSPPRAVQNRASLWPISGPGTSATRRQGSQITAISTAFGAREENRTPDLRITSQSIQTVGTGRAWYLMGFWVVRVSGYHLLPRYTPEFVTHKWPAPRPTSALGRVPVGHDFSNLDDDESVGGDHAQHRLRGEPASPLHCPEHGGPCVHPAGGRRSGSQSGNHLRDSTGRLTGFAPI